MFPDIMKRRKNKNQSDTPRKSLFAIPAIYKTEINKAETEADKSNLVSAILILDNLIKLYPDEKESYELRFYYKVQRGDLEGALNDSNRLLKIDQNDTNSLFLNATILSTFEKYAESETILKKIIKIESKNTNALFLYGYVKFKQFDLNKAIKLYGDAIELKPTKYHAYAQRGLCYAFLGKELEALSDFEKIPPTEFNDQSYALVGKGILIYLAGNVYQALNYYDEAIKIDPRNPLGYVFKGLLKMELRDPTADDDLLLANKAGGQLAGSNTNTIYMYIKMLMMKDLDRARSVATYSVKKHPESSILWECLSAVHFISQEPEKSIEAANRAIELDKQNEKAWYFRAMSKLMNGDKIGCEKDIELATEVFGESVLIYTIAGACEYKNISAEEYLEKALSIDPDNPIILFAKGGVLYSKGEKAKAMEYFRRAHENGHYFTESESKEFSENMLKEMMPTSEKANLLQDESSEINDQINTEFAPNRKYQNFHFEAFQCEYDKEKNQQIAYDNICRIFPKVLDPDKFESFIIQYRLWSKSMR